MKKLFFLFLFVFALGITNSQGQYSKLFDFPADNDLSYPQFSSTVYDGEWLYAVSTFGGDHRSGCIYKIKPDGTSLTKLHDFDGSTNGSMPQGSLILSGSVLYGMTANGGQNNMGIIYKINTDGSGFTNLMEFNGTLNGSYPHGSLIVDGSELFGMTYNGGANNMGIIFKINTNGTGFNKLLEFNGTNNGSNPHGSLNLSGSVLFGMTQYGGTNNKGSIFEINTDGTGYEKLWDFDEANGSFPNGSLNLQGTVLYGMTNQGGINSKGTIFQINTDGSGFNKIIDFDEITNGCYPCGSIEYSESVLYGMTSGGGANKLGSIFKINTNGTGYTTLQDFNGTNGRFPNGSISLYGSVLYGTTSEGGVSNKGALFKINTDGSEYAKILDFNMAIDGCSPYASLCLSGQILYGMTNTGGIDGVGTIFKMNADGSGYSKLFDFSGITSGSFPQGSLNLDGSVLYGMTSSGGVYNYGTVFKINADGSGFTKLLDFNKTTNGCNPFGSLCLSSSVLYGMTYEGGINNSGTLFKINTNGSGYFKLLDFENTNGSHPRGSLCISGSILYGMTGLYGSYNNGAIFKINTDGTGYTKLMDFNGTATGSYPFGSLTISGSKLYGTTAGGGTNGSGTIFKINTDGSGFSKLFDFNRWINGGSPNSLLLSGNVLFGLTSSGSPNGYGGIFKISTDGYNFEGLGGFNFNNGINPMNSALISNSNTLYGVTSGGGAFQAGVIYKCDLPLSNLIITRTSGFGIVNSKFNATFTFNKDVTGFELSDITIINGIASNLIAVSPKLYNADITPTSSGDITISVDADKAQNLYGINNSASNSLIVAADIIIPTLIVSRTSGTGSVNTKFNATFTFSEDVTGFDLSDLTITNSTASNFMAQSPKIYTVDIAPTSSGDVKILVESNKVENIFGINNLASNILTIQADITAPTAVLSRSSGSGPVNSKFNATITFSEDVTGFDISDLIVTNGTAGNFVSTNSKLYTVDITPTASGDVSINIAADKAIDLAGNNNTAAELKVIVDLTAPTIAITRTSGSGAVNEKFNITITFSEDVTGFDLTDLTVSNGTAGNFVAANAKVYSVYITPVASGNITMLVAENKAQDLTGNQNTASNSLVVLAATITSTANFVVLVTGNTSTVTVPVSIFQDMGLTGTITYTATLQDGSPLPSWIIFNPETLTFTINTGNKSAIDNLEQIIVVINGKDQTGKTAAIQTTFTKSFMTSIDKKELKTLSISPNPSKETIVFKNDFVNNLYFIYNLHGSIVQSGVIESKDQEIKLTNLKNGIYLLTIKTKDKYYIEKFIKE